MVTLTARTNGPFFLGVLLSAAAIVLGSWGISRHGATGPAWIGLALGALGIVIWLLLVAAFSAVTDGYR